ncbi:MAG: hypothetical protein ABIJ97_01685 [Bacteroidota bacterium]
MFFFHKDELKVYSESRLLKILVAILLPVSAIVLYWFGDFLYKSILLKIPPTIKYSLLLILIIVLILRNTYINNLRSTISEKTRKKIVFGLIWIDNIPICQKCNGQLTDYVYKPDDFLFEGPYFRCYKCNLNNYLKVGNISNPHYNKIMDIVKRSK